MSTDVRYYSETFNPLVYPREYLVVYYRPPGGEWSVYVYRVKYIYPVLPFIVTGNDLSPGGRQTLELKDYEPKTETQLYHLRFEPLDDIEIQLRGTVNSAYYTIRDTELYFGSNYTTHTASATVSTAGTPALFWKLTTGRSARVTELAITNNSGSDATVYLTDSGGTQYFSPPIKVTAGSTVIATLDDYLFDTYVKEDIYITADQAPVTAVGTVEELGKGFDPRFAQVLFMKGAMPTMTIINPTNVTIRSPRIRFYGFEYLVERVDRSVEELEKYSVIITTR